MTVYEGAPKDKREEREASCYELLDKLGIKYQRVDHEPAYTMEDCKAVDDTLGVKMCKNLVLTNRQQTAFYLLLMPGDKPFKTKDLSEQINSARLSFAGADKMEELLGVVPGCASVLSLKNDVDNLVTLLIDEDVLKQEYMCCHPCVNTSSLKIAMKDIRDVFLKHCKHSVTKVKL
ncbi:MAG: prolyl-tRNA synthetase associated domain-containing protein [Ruminococcaceae bacterium]|nr:prolyl-tRNA synthetase associated domain-containing protein [Oscillospiraceae bacterium]